MCKKAKETEKPNRAIKYRIVVFRRKESRYAADIVKQSDHVCDVHIDCSGGGVFVFSVLISADTAVFLRMGHRIAIAIACADLGATYWVGSTVFFGHTCFGFYRSVRGVAFFVI